MTRPTAARPTTSPVSRMSSARVRKTWVVGSMGGPRVEVLLARAVVVPRVLVLWKLLRYTFVHGPKKEPTVVVLSVVVV